LTHHLVHVLQKSYFVKSWSVVLVGGDGSVRGQEPGAGIQLHGSCRGGSHPSWETCAVGASLVLMIYGLFWL